MAQAKHTSQILKKDCSVAGKALVLAGILLIAILMSGCNCRSSHNHSDEVPYVDKAAAFPGGDQKLTEWIYANLRITDEMAESDVTGRVIVNFIVKADGSIGDVEIVNSLHPDYDEEAVRLVKSMPKFTPATIDGKPVDYEYTLPIIFRPR